MIKNVKLSKSKGHDGISLEVLKLISNEISSSITLIINQTLTTEIFPDKLKIAKVVPIFKKDSKKEFQNYRPISVLPVISKIFESVIHDQLNEYVYKQQIILCTTIWLYEKCFYRISVIRTN